VHDEPGHAGDGAIATPTRQSTPTTMTTSMPSNSKRPPRICSTNCEKKLASAATSPSTRSMMSPGEVAVW
jgi:hypothetical protein